MEEDIEDFIDSRINRNYNKLRTDKKWQDRNKELDEIYKNLFNKLSEHQQKELAEIIDIKNIIIGYENNFAYKLGASDTLKLLRT